MSIMDKLKAAEATFAEASGVADEIVTLGDGLLTKLKAHRDELKSVSSALLDRLGGVADAIKVEAPVEGPASPEPIAEPDWTALQAQAAKLPG